MGDDRMETGSLDRYYRINVDVPYELRNWAQYFAVTEAKLKATVDKVGSAVAAVRTHLANEPRW